ncbi:hypothetical protein GGR16_000645 [Chelatococcus caeni]|uniref:Porin n=1 Tax=Chelatococcus caeni TaxID=1348468 RepID=A0A840BWB9_9HYPH|nr:porin [Chelatococcus caeni]MBB4015639.1 hypothetical protein [Chelatococcus caeni]
MLSRNAEDDGRLDRLGEKGTFQGAALPAEEKEPLPKGLETLEVTMKLAKSLLLGTVAGLAAAAGAQAADLPMRKAAPVEYVRVCSVHGAGFFYIPGSDTCIKIGGRVRAEYRYLEPTSSYSLSATSTGVGSINVAPGVWFNPGRRSDATGFRARGRINVDARTATEWGTLRTFVQVDVTANTGNYLGAGRNGFGPGVDTTDVALDKAYIQWAGITAGRISSFFDFYAAAINFGSGYMASLGSDNGSVNTLAYTATFGNGFSATLALEDRSAVVRNVASTANVLGGTNNILGGQRMPSIVGNLRVDQGWGSAQLSGVVQQLNASTLDPLGGRIDSEYGYAIQAGVKVNLPMLAAGDALWLQAAYADGALGRLGLGNLTTFGTLYGVAVDGVELNGSIKRTKGWGVTAAFLHYWTPSIRQAVFGNYTAVDYSGSAIAAYSTVDGFATINDFKVWTVGTNVIWSPVKAFDIGVEVLYQKLDPKGRFIFPNGSSKADVDVWEARLRFQRDF